MVKQIIWSKRAKEDRKEILEYWLVRNKSNIYPLKLNNVFKEAIQWIADHPFVRRKTDFPGVYVKRVRDYLILFEDTDSKIIILTIWDTRRNPDDLEDIIDENQISETE